MSKAATANSKPYRKRTKRRNNPAPLHHQKKKGPKER